MPPYKLQKDKPHASALRNNLSPIGDFGGGKWSCNTFAVQAMNIIQSLGNFTIKTDNKTTILKASHDAISIQNNALSSTDTSSKIFLCQSNI